MCCKTFGKKIIVFSISFFIGVCLAPPNNLTEIPQVQQQTLDVETKATYFKSPESPDCNNPLPELIQKRKDITDLFAKNKNLSKKQILDKAKELEEVNMHIEAFRNMEKSEKYIQKEVKPVTDLLYRENCYDF